MNKKIGLYGLIIGAGFALSGIGANIAHAECYYMPSPCGAGNIRQQSSNWHHQNHQNNYVIIDRERDNSSYQEGYADGVRDGRAAARRTSGHHIVKKSRNHQRATSAHVRSNRAQNRTRVTHNIVRQQRTSHVISSNSYVRYQAPIKDYARTYNASEIGYSVPVAAFAGRGESWVQTSGYAVRYATPTNISTINGQRCGYSNGYSQNGQIINRGVMVCHCAQGWMPPR